MLDITEPTDDLTSEPTVKGTLPWPDFTARLEYLVLTPRQRAFVRAYLESGNATEATVAAYRCQNRVSACALSYRVRQSPNVIAALACYLGTSETTPLAWGRMLADVQMHLRAAVPGSVAAQRLLMQEERLLRGTRLRSEAPEAYLPPTEPAKPAVDPRVPADALKVWLDERGACIGYRDAAGEDVKL